jgi:hypothetical protein
VKKSNILIAITPYVVSDLSDLRRVAEKKLRERREFIERFSSLEDTSNLDKLEVDTHRKRGMLEEINRSVREMEEDERQLHAYSRARPTGRVGSRRAILGPRSGQQAWQGRGFVEQAGGAVLGGLAGQARGRGA